MDGSYYFLWPDYLVLAVVLMLSAAIGFYYACTGDKQRTTKEYLLADKNMHWFPVGCSLLASTISSQTVLGLPGEVYTFGTIVLYHYVLKTIPAVIAVAFYLPVMRKLETISVFKYIELRFGKALKYVLESATIFFTMFYVTLVIYGPALSISAVTGINIWLAVFSIALVAILYTVLGGIKAVLWTDTLQLIIMLLGIFLILIVGTAKEGGIREVWEVNRLSGRLDFLEPEKFLDVDPRMRHTVWGLLFGIIPMYINIYGLSVTSVQRSLTLKTSKDIALAYGMAIIGSSLFGIVCSLLGLLIFAHNRYCDPIADGYIFSKDQLYPLYIMEVFGHLPGLPGVILASLVSASLSTISSMLNSTSGVLLQDYVRPCRPNLSDKHAAIISKIITLLLGFYCIALVLFSRQFGNGLLSLGITFAGIISGPSFAVFTLGIFFPIINHTGAMIGYICGVALNAWMGFGGLTNRAYIYHYPTTTVGCNVTDVLELSNLTTPVYDPSTWNPSSHYRSGVDAVYDISYLWLGLIGASVTMIVAFIISLFPTKKNEEQIDRRLLSPIVLKACCVMPTSWRARIKPDGIEEKNNPNSTEEDNETAMEKF